MKRSRDADELEFITSLQDGEAAKYLEDLQRQLYSMTDQDQKKAFENINKVLLA